MDTNLLERKFEQMGARVKLDVRPSARPIAIDIRRDRHGEYFDILLDARERREIEVLDLQPRQRHLLLMVRPATEPGQKPPAQEKQKFLCGHDERAWFVAAVPERAGASTVRNAMEALKPPLVRLTQERLAVPAKRRNRRKNQAFVRQGEWFFIPESGMRVRPQDVLRHEPLQRSGGKPHRAEFAFRTGGETVYVSRQHPQGLTTAAYARLIDRRPELKKQFRMMVRNAAVFVKGRISHPDHKTITLHDWHLVQMNTETQAQAMRHVVFLD